MPTQLLYDDNGTVKKWGYEIEPTDTPLRCIKLLLDHCQTFLSWVSKHELLQALTKVKKTATTAIADYLTQILDFAKKDIEEKYTESMLSTTPIKYVLTVPAVWSDTAKQATLKAATMAGMGKTVHLVSEPEAAAVHALSTIKQKDVHVGDTFIVCDAGGGTLDLITYEVQSLTPLCFREVVPGTGGLCGAAFPNYGFEALMRERLGFTFFEGIVQRRPKSWSTALEYFESYIKRNFDPVQENGVLEKRSFSVPFPDVADNREKGIDCGFLSLSTSEVASIFRPVIDGVLQHLQDQMDKCTGIGKIPDGMILVGGFGQSRYLFKRIKSRFADDAKCTGKNSQGTKSPSRSHRTLTASISNVDKKALLVLQPPTAWTAVQRGAVLRGVSGHDLVSSRKARHHYGIRLNVFFEEGVHPASSKYWDDYDQVYRARDQMVWMVHKGDTVISNSPILENVCVTVTSTFSNNITNLFYCDDDEAPSQYTGGSSSDILLLCSLSVNLGEISPRFWSDKVTASGKKKRLCYQIGFFMQSGRLSFDYRLESVIYGSVDAKFE